MQKFFRNNQIATITVGSVLATVITTWIASFNVTWLWNWLPFNGLWYGLWYGLSLGTRNVITDVAIAVLLVLIAASATIYASRLARLGTGQAVISNGIAPRLKLLISPERAKAPLAMKAIEDLEKMIGLAPVKREVNTLLARLQFERKRVEQGHTPEAIGMHMVFTGPPGVGKTQVARAIGDVLRSLNVLRSGHLVQVDREQLVAGYTGQTATKTMAKCREALDGILFIDEAYSLVEKVGDGADFGKEAITTLMKFMDDNRDRIIVIVAGYPNEMRRFIGANPGLAGRFTKYIEFPSYSAKELCEIFRRMALQQRFTLPEGFEPKVTAWISEQSRLETWANAREMRTLLEKTREAQAVRLVSDNSAVDVSRIAIIDILKAMIAMGGKA